MGIATTSRGARASLPDRALGVEILNHPAVEEMKRRADDAVFMVNPETGEPSLIEPDKEYDVSDGARLGRQSRANRRGSGRRGSS